MTTRLLFVVNDPSFFLSHRLPIALAARKQGYDVHVATTDGEAKSAITAAGFTHHRVALTRSGKNPFKELTSIGELYFLMRRLRPAIVHLVTTKPVLYGGIAARMAGVPGVVSAVSGLGSVFVAEGWFAKVVLKVVEALYRAAFNHSNITVILQNPDDRELLMSIGAVDWSGTALIRGSGVDLEKYPVVAEALSPAVVTFASRLLKDKGILEFVEAARTLKARAVDARFQVIGDVDPGNPTSVTQVDLDRWADEGVVELLGFRKDIPELFAQAHLVVLPSYREGLPKALVEAAAAGRAVVTTDVPGCRDAIEPGKSGVLVPERDVIALADAIQTLVEDPVLRRKMGAEGRALAEREFGIEKIVAAHLAVYEKLQVRLQAEPA